MATSLALLALLVCSAAGLEVRVLSGQAARGQVLSDQSDQRLVVNSNNRYIYPAQQVPEYNIYALYLFPDPDPPSSSNRISSRWSPTPSSTPCCACRSKRTGPLPTS